MLFCPFISENELLGGTSHTYQGNFSANGVTEIVHSNRCKFEPYVELVDETSENFNAELVDNQDAYGQIESDETDHTMKLQKKQDSENSNGNLYSSASLMAEIPPDNEIAGSIRSLNEKQRMVFNVVHKWCRNFIKSLATKRCFTVDPIRIFLSCSGGTGKSHLIKTIYQAVLKELLCNAKDPEKPCVLLLGPTAISAVNIGGTTIYSGLGIKPGPKLLGLSDKMKAS